MARRKKTNARKKKASKKPKKKTKKQTKKAKKRASPRSKKTARKSSKTAKRKSAPKVALTSLKIPGLDDYEGWTDLAQQKILQIVGVAKRLDPIRKLAPKVPIFHIDIKFVDAEKMRELNQHYKRKNEPTDILSFPGPEPFYSMGVLGELVICLPVMVSQAQELKLKPDQELQVLLVHGILHLIGYDHEQSEGEAAEMLKLEQSILQSLPVKRLQGLIERTR